MDDLGKRSGGVPFTFQIANPLSTVHSYNVRVIGSLKDRDGLLTLM